MNKLTDTPSRFRYQVETAPVARGGRAWSVFHQRPDGRRVVLASGTMLGEAGEQWDHEALVAFVQMAQDRRSMAN